MRTVKRLVLFLLSISAASAQTDRDFSGRWYLKPEKSEVQELIQPPDPIVKIEQKGSTIHLFRTGDGDRAPEEIGTYNTDGTETRRHVGQALFSSQTKWEGAALLVNTLVSMPDDSYSIADRWKVSKDGSRLTIHRQIERLHSETEATLIYEREAKVTPPTLIAIAPPAGNIEPKPSRPAELASEEPVLRTTPRTDSDPFLVLRGTKIPLRLINSVSTKHSAPGDRVYLETVYPILSHGHVIIPPGSYVIGSLSEVKQAGRVKGKSEFFLRFDSLTLPNGTTRDFRSRMSNMDGDGKGTLDRTEGRVQGEGGKGADSRTVAETTAAGTSIGAIAGSAAGHLGMGAGIGAAVGALGGLAAVMATRGPDAVLQRGSTVEMVLDRDLSFTADEVRH